jgi:hypothetical protein
MILLNFGRKMDAITIDLVRRIGNIPIEEQIMLPVEADDVDSFMAELQKLFVRVKLTEAELVRDRVVINPSRNRNAMLALCAYLLGKCGGLPYVIVTRTAPFGMSARVEVSGVIDLQEWLDGKKGISFPPEPH